MRVEVMQKLEKEIKELDEQIKKEKDEIQLLHKQKLDPLFEKKESINREISEIKKKIEEKVIFMSQIKEKVFELYQEEYMQITNKINNYEISKLRNEYMMEYTFTLAFDVDNKYYVIFEYGPPEWFRVSIISTENNDNIVRCNIRDVFNKSVSSEILEFSRYVDIDFDNESLDDNLIKTHPKVWKVVDMKFNEKYKDENEYFFIMVIAVLTSILDNWTKNNIILFPKQWKDLYGDFSPKISGLTEIPNDVLLMTRDIKNTKYKITPIKITSM